mgnify:FL=1
MSKPIRKRSEVAAEFTWDLTDIFPSDEAWRAEYEALKPYAETVAAYQGRLGESAEMLLAYFRLDDELNVRVGRLYGYANCKADEDTSNGFYQDLRGKALSLSVTLSGAGAFAASELLALSDETLTRFYAEQPDLATYRRPIERVRRRRAHILSPECEALLASAGEMADGPDAIFGAFHNADLRFPAVTDGAGAEQPLTDATFVPLLQSGDRTLRRNAFETYYATLGGYRNTLAATLDAQFKQLRFFANARRYPSTLDAALDATEVPVSVYDSLIESVHANLDKMYRYVALRRRLLGVDELHMYDVYTPIVPDVAEEIPFEQAKATVLDALAVLGEDYTAMLREGFDHRWLDVYPNVGKRGGAYSSGIARPHPYVLLNQTDDLDSQFTIAHEMGHAMHSYLSCKHQPVCTSDYVIFVAEVASTCNEVLLMRHLLNESTDKRERAYLINHFLDQFKGTVYRQTMFAEFERELGRMAERGETLTTDALDEKYLALNRLYFGPDMISDAQIALEWARIPHFYYNYYVFQYATGFSAAVALADRILREGEPAVADYKRFLSGGSSTDPISLLKLAGVDMSTPAPVDAALAMFGELVDELDALTR